MGEIRATTLPLRVVGARPSPRVAPANAVGVFVAVALRTLLLAGVAAAGILVLLPAVLGAVGTTVLGAP